MSRFGDVTLDSLGAEARRRAESELEKVVPGGDAFARSLGYSPVVAHIPVTVRRFPRPKSDGSFERRKFRAWCKSEGIPTPTHEFHYAKPERKFRADFAWPALRILLEVQGGVYTRQAHGSISGVLKDNERSNEANIRGWCLLRVLPRDLYSPATADLLWRAIRSR